MANTAAYSGLRQGELFALTAGQVAAAARVITVDRKVVEVGGKLYLEAPKGRKRRSTIYPVRTPEGYPLAGQIAARAEEARAEQGAGDQPPRADVPLPPRRLVAVLQLRPPRPGARLPGRRVARRGGTGTWTWHSLRHVFCTAALSCWRLEPPTSPAWPGTPTSASPSTCTSAPPPASWTAPAQPPNSASSATPTEGDRAGISRADRTH